jgi:hypothetical protein
MYHRAVTKKVTTNNSSLVTVSGNDHQRGSFQKLVKAEFGPRENLLIVASHANEPPIIKKVVTIALGNGFKRDLLLPDFINENPVKIKRPGIKYLGWK